MYTSLTGKTWVLITIAAIVIAAILAYAFLYHPAQRSGSQGNVAYAPAGQLIDGFPAALVIGAVSTTTEASYRIAYQGVTQDTATFVASGSIEDAMPYLFDRYQQYFYTNGWSVAEVSDGQGPQRSISAAYGSSTANVTIVARSAASSAVTATITTAN